MSELTKIMGDKVILIIQVGRLDDKHYEASFSVNSTSNDETLIDFKILHDVAEVRGIADNAVNALMGALMSLQPVLKTDSAAMAIRVKKGQRDN